MRRERSGLGFALTTLILVAACSSALPPTDRPSRSAVPSPRPSPTPSDPDCIVIASYSSAAPPTTDWMRQSDLIAPGTVERVDPAEWSTPGAVRPDPALVRTGRSSAVIWRPVQVGFEQAWRGTLAGVTKTVVVGGTVGCDSYATDNDPGLVAGSRDVLFLGQIQDGNGQLSGIVSVYEAWPIGADGLVSRPVEEPIALEKLRRILSAP